MTERTESRFARQISSLFYKNETGIALSLIVLMIIIGFVNIDFFASGNLLDVLRSCSYYFIVAAPLTCMLISCGIDLSFGSVASLGGLACGWGLTLLHLPIWLSVLLGLSVGALMGLFTSLLVVRLRLPAFITTLGLSYVINGFILIATGGKAVTGFISAFKVLGQGSLTGKLYWSIIIAVAFGVIFSILLNQTKFGREIYAVGGNQETARLAGINVAMVSVVSQLMLSVAAAGSGIIRASRFNSAQPTGGSGSELIIIAAVIIGGTSMSGGSGTITGSFLGCLLLAVINNGLVMMRVSSYWSNLIFGVILIAALTLDRFRQSRSSFAR
jgi:ribose/xylose/arabinose/galactoside ABC-type transport system permease subunit